MDTIMLNILNEVKTYRKLEDAIFVVKLERTDSSEMVRVGVLYKRSLAFYLKDKAEKPKGYFEFKNIPSLLFGYIDGFSFIQLENSIHLNYLNGTKGSKSKEYKNPPPPPLMEPDVWIYERIRGKYKFIGVNKYTLLE